MAQPHPTRSWIVGVLAPLMGAFCLSSPAAAEIYQWRDAEGNLHFGEMAPAEAIDVERRQSTSERAAEAARAAARPPPPAAHDPFTYEDPRGLYRLDFPAGWDVLPIETVTQIWGEKLASKVEAAFYYDTDPDMYTCQCALIARMPEDGASILEPSRYDRMPLHRGLGNDPIGATGPSEPPIIYYDPATEQFWFRQEAVGRDGVPNSTLTVMRRTSAGGRMMSVLQPLDTLAAYHDGVLPVVSSFEPIGEIEPPPMPEGLRHVLIGTGVLSVVLLMVGFNRGGVKRALLFGVAPGLSLIALAAAAVTEAPEWSSTISFPYLFGYALGLPTAAFLGAWVQEKTRNLDQAMRWYVIALVVCLALQGLNIVSTTVDQARKAGDADAVAEPTTPTPPTATD